METGILEKNRLSAVLVLLGVVLLPILASHLSRRGYSGAIHTEEQLVERNASAVARLFGEFRAGLSDVMFVKTEQYLHSGISYVAHLDMEEMERTGRVEHGEDQEDLVATIIRTPGEDWRHFIGDLERTVKPWLDPGSGHGHTSGEELLPWYWMAVAANPHNVRAYRITAFWLMALDDGPRPEEALRFVEDGIRNNPDSFALYRSKGQILVQMKKYLEAFETFTRGAELARRKRPMGGYEKEYPSDMREEDFRALMRFRAFLLERFGRLEECMKAIEEYERLVDERRSLRTLRERVEKALFSREVMEGI